jgi:hypothetical protein
MWFNKKTNIFRGEIMENKDTVEKLLSDRVKNIIELSRIDTLFGDIVVQRRRMKKVQWV